MIGTKPDCSLPASFLFCPEIDRAWPLERELDPDADAIAFNHGLEVSRCACDLCVREVRA